MFLCNQQTMRQLLWVYDAVMDCHTPITPNLTCSESKWHKEEYLDKKLPVNPFLCLDQEPVPKLPVNPVSCLDHDLAPKNPVNAFPKNPVNPFPKHPVNPVPKNPSHPVLKLPVDPVLCLDQDPVPKNPVSIISELSLNHDLELPDSLPYPE